MKLRAATLVLLGAVGLACSENPASAPIESSMSPQLAPKQVNGTGLVLSSVTGLAVPLIGQLGEVVIDQAVITHLVLVEDLVGAIVGLEAQGVLQLTGGVLGTDVVTEDFATAVGITSSGPGQCDVISIDLGQISVDALVANVDVPAATLTARGSGAVGSLLCNLGNLLGGLTGGLLGGGAQGLVNAINNQI